MNKTIFVDCDDTLINFCDKWFAVLNKKYGTSYSKYDVKDWEMTGLFEGISIDELLTPLYKDNFWDDILPIEGSQEYLKKLVDDGYDVYISTASDYRTVQPKIEKIIHKLYPFIDDDHVIIIKNKWLLNGDYIIDDNSQNLVNSPCKKIIFTQPHNRSINRPDIKRANTWQECYNIIQAG